MTIPLGEHIYAFLLLFKGHFGGLSKLYYIHSALVSVSLSVFKNDVHYMCSALV